MHTNQKYLWFTGEPPERKSKRHIFMANKTEEMKMMKRKWSFNDNININNIVLSLVKFENKYLKS